MNHLKNKILLIAALCLSTVSRGQTKVIVEDIQSYSTISPKANYWKMTNNRNLLEALDSGLFKVLGLERSQKTSPNNIALTKSNQLGKININWSKTSDIPLHAYIELYEMEPDFAYRNNLLDLPASKKDSIQSIWFISCTILDQQKSILFKKTILMSLLPNVTLGMGYPVDIPVSTPTYLTKAIAKGIAQMTPQIANMAYLEAKVPSIYTTDNVWMPYIHQQPRIVFDTTKNFINYVHNTETHILRVPSSTIQKINSKDRTNANPFFNILDDIKSRPSNSSREYYQAFQRLRDVKKNVDYLIETYIEFNPYTTSDLNTSSPIAFFSDTLNKIYLDNKVIGQFKVKENSTLNDKWINPNEVYNGYDSTEKYNLGTLYEKQKINFSKIIEGTLHQNRFAILYNSETEIKTVYMDQQLAFIVKGNKKPYQMVLVDNNLNEATIDFLLLFTYSELFQMPSLN